MGDYLKLVTDRSQGKPAAVQPRVPSLFEPPAASLSARFTPFQSRVSEAGPEPVAAATETIRYATPAPQERVVPSARQNRDKSSTAENIGDQVERQASRPAAALKPETQNQTAQPHKASAAREPEPVVVRTNEPAMPRPKAKTGKTEDDAGENANTPSFKPRQRKISEDEKAASEAARFAVTGRKHDPASFPQPKPEPVHRQAAQAVMPIVVHQPSQRSAALVAEPVEDLRPVINVMIGRISVNAVTERAAVPVRAPQPNAPSMSLDQYLKQRGGRP